VQHPVETVALWWG